MIKYSLSPTTRALTRLTLYHSDSLSLASYRTDAHALATHPPSTTLFHETGVSGVAVTTGTDGVGETFFGLRRAPVLVGGSPAVGTPRPNRCH